MEIIGYNRLRGFSLVVARVFMLFIRIPFTASNRESCRSKENNRGYLLDLDQRIEEYNTDFY